MPISVSTGRPTTPGAIDEYEILSGQHGTTAPPLLAGRPPAPEELQPRTDRSTAPPTEGRRLVVDLRDLDYFRSRQLLSEALRALQPADSLLVVSSVELRALRFEMEATLSHSYRWCLHVALPVDAPTEFTTVVERL